MNNNLISENNVNTFVQKLKNFKDKFVARIKNAKNIKGYLFDLAFYFVLFLIIGFVFNKFNFGQTAYTALAIGFVCGICNGIRRDVKEFIEKTFSDKDN